MHEAWYIIHILRLASGEDGKKYYFKNETAKEKLRRHFYAYVMVCENGLRKWGRERCCLRRCGREKYHLGNNQIKEDRACSCIMGRERHSERNLPNFSGCKGDSRRFALSDSVNVILQKSRIRSLCPVFCLVYLGRLSLM